MKLLLLFLPSLFGFSFFPLTAQRNKEVELAVFSPNQPLSPPFTAYGVFAVPSLAAECQKGVFLGTLAAPSARMRELLNPDASLIFTPSEALPNTTAICVVVPQGTAVGSSAAAFPFTQTGSQVTLVPAGTVSVSGFTPLAMQVNEVGLMQPVTLWGAGVDASVSLEIHFDDSWHNLTLVSSSEEGSATFSLPPVLSPKTLSPYSLRYKKAGGVTTALADFLSFTNVELFGNSTTTGLATADSGKVIDWDPTIYNGQGPIKITGDLCYDDYLPHKFPQCAAIPSDGGARLVFARDASSCSHSVITTTWFHPSVTRTSFDPLYLVFANIIGEYAVCAAPWVLGAKLTPLPAKLKGIGHAVTSSSPRGAAIPNPIATANVTVRFDGFGLGDGDRVAMTTAADPRDPVWLCSAQGEGVTISNGTARWTNVTLGSYTFCYFFKEAMEWSGLDPKQVFLNVFVLPPDPIPSPTPTPSPHHTPSPTPKPSSKPVGPTPSSSAVPAPDTQRAGGLKKQTIVAIGAGAGGGLLLIAAAIFLLVRAKGARAERPTEVPAAYTALR
jgi:hypothetical protein